MREQRHIKGFTLMELLVTVSVAGVLMAAAVPSFTEFVANTRVSSASNLLVTHLNAARNEAITRAMPVTVCASTDQASCSGSTDWTSGWIVFTDATGDPGVLDGDDELLHVNQPSNRDLSLQSGSTYVRFGTIGQSEAG